jgi:Sulfotransferase family
MPVEVGWIFSLIRSGSSIAAYAAASPWNLPVADEVFGPWVRTGKLYQFPREQRELVEAFKGAGHQLTPEVIQIANRLFELMGRDSGRVVSKCPHLMFTPEAFGAAFPHHRAVYLIRNPIHRLNSQYLRGWEWMIEKDHDVRVYTEFARRWLAHRERGGVSVTFDDLRARPREWFGEVYRGLGWEAGEATIERAEAYRAAKYHSSSKEIARNKDPDLVDSERDWRVPEAAIRAYLDDPFLSGFMRDRGWATRTSAYRPGLITRVVTRIRWKKTGNAR